MTHLTVIVHAQRQIIHTIALPSKASRIDTLELWKSSKAGTPKAIVTATATTAETVAATQDAHLRNFSSGLFDARRERAQTAALSRVATIPRKMTSGARSSTVAHTRTLCLRNGEIGCVVKGGGPQRESNPPGNWFAPPGSNQSSRGGNETAEASGAEGRKGDSVSMQAVT